MGQPDPLPRVALLVTDLDNTLYDWFAMWYPAFNAMLETVCSKSGVSRAALLDEIRAIHQERGTSEYSYLLNELPSLKKLNLPQEITEVYRDAIRRYRSMRQRNLHLYPGVRNALVRIKEFGVPIVVYTESLGFYSAWRLRELNLDGVVDYLYSPPDHDFPEDVTPEMLRSRPPEAYELKKTEYRETKRGILKPDPQILQRILQELGASASQTVYVGDSLMKDVAMAQDAGMFDVLAKYGAVKDHSAYRLLQQVSHWSEDDVQRESRINERPNVTPSYILHDRFDEIFDFFKFGDQA
jgi:phosphoglycolate phosphatase